MKFLSIIIIFFFNTDSLSKATLIDTMLADKYFNKADQLFNNAQYDSSVFYLQKAMQSLVKDLNSINIYINPQLKIVSKPGEAPKIVNVNSTIYFFDALEGKADALYEKWMMDDGMEEVAVAVAVLTNGNPGCTQIGSLQSAIESM